MSDLGPSPLASLCLWSSDGRERLHVSVFIGVPVDGTVGGGQSALFSIVDFRYSAIAEYGREGVN